MYQSMLFFNIIFITFRLEALTNQNTALKKKYQAMAAVSKSMLHM